MSTPMKWKNKLLSMPLLPTDSYWSKDSYLSLLFDWEHCSYIPPQWAVDNIITTLQLQTKQQTVGHFSLRLCLVHLQPALNSLKSENDFSWENGLSCSFTEQFNYYSHHLIKAGLQEGKKKDLWCCYSVTFTKSVDIFSWWCQEM